MCFAPEMHRVRLFIVSAIALATGSAGSARELELAPDLVATVFHDGVGRARHIAVRDNGDVYVASQQGRSRPGRGTEATPGALVALRDEDGDGAADRVEHFGPSDVGTGLAIRGDSLYYSSDQAVFRVQLGDELVPAGAAEIVAGGFPVQRSHAAKPIAFDGDGHLYVNSGAPSNACQEKSRTPGSPGLAPCPQLARSGGIWRFAPDATWQDQERDGTRYATGTRQIVALDWNPDAGEGGALFFVMHGRDQLDTLWPAHFSAEQRAELPAEEFHIVREGDDFGWPYTYFDPQRGLRMVAPEYGGDGATTAQTVHPAPLVAFPAHWAPNDLLFYRGPGLPERYRGGAFVAFHGSWNRAPLPQQGFHVVFVPFANGRPSGDWEVVAQGFRAEGQPTLRPSGLAEGPDGALYVTEDTTGRIWRITAAP